MAISDFWSLVNIAFLCIVASLIFLVALKRLGTEERQIDPVYSISNKVVVVTGCDSGIGFDLAKRVVSWGYHVVACCLLAESGGARALKGTDAEVLQLDVKDRAKVNALYTKLLELQGQGKEIYCLVNNAGVMTYARTEWHTWDLVENQLLINLSGTVQVTRILLPLLRHHNGRIINVSSPQGLISSPLMGVYCASKWGVEAFSQALRRELDGSGVDVIVVRPFDLAKKTSILRGNGTHLRTMWTQMTQEAKEEYQLEYEAMTNEFDNSFAKFEEPDCLDDFRLTEAFRSAITSSSPSHSYSAAPFVVKAFFGVLQLLPVSWTDWIVKHNLHIVALRWTRS